MSQTINLADASLGRAPNDVDAHVGGVIRARRRALGLSQQQVGELIGVSFQQVQKYENGANRVSCSMLVRIADALQAAPGEFFPTTTAGKVNELDDLLYRQANTRGGIDLAQHYTALDDHRRAALLNVAAALAPDPEPRLAHVA